MSTIAAISTAPGNAGIGIIRLSGENCFEILEKYLSQKQRPNKRIYNKIWKYSKQGKK